MWIKMDQEQKVRFLDDQIKKYRKGRMFLFYWGSLFMLVFSVLLNFIFFYPSVLIQNIAIPTFPKAILLIVVVYAGLESILLLLLRIDIFRFNRMNRSEKEKYINENLRRQANKICPNCGIIYDISETRCSKCGSDLDMSHDYLWVDDEAKGTPRGTVTD